MRYYNHINTVFSYYAILDSTFTTIKKFKKRNFEGVNNLVPLKNGNYAITNQQFSFDGAGNSVIKHRFAVLDSNFEVLYSNIERLRIFNFAFVNTNDVIYTTRNTGNSYDSLVMARINGVGEP